MMSSQLKQKGEALTEEEVRELAEVHQHGWLKSVIAEAPTNSDSDTSQFRHETNSEVENEMKRQKVESEEMKGEKRKTKREGKSRAEAKSSMVRTDSWVSQHSLPQPLDAHNNNTRPYKQDPHGVRDGLLAETDEESQQAEAEDKTLELLEDSSGDDDSGVFLFSNFTKEGVYMVRQSEDKMKTFTCEASGAGGLDTCCSRTIAGTSWFDEYLTLLKPEDRKKVEGPMASKVTFQFGDGGQLNSGGKYYIPVELHGHKVKLAVEVVQSDIPLLISHTTMSRAAMVLDTGRKTVTVFGVTRPMQQTTLGHPIISVIPRSPAPFAEGVLLTHQTQQFMKVPELSEIRAEAWMGLHHWKNATDVPPDQQRKMIKKVHDQAGHMAKAKLKFFLKKCSIEWDEGLMNKELDKLEQNCEGCILKKKKPARPVACIPVADGFNQCVGVDLKIGKDGIILYVIDMWSKLIAARFVPSKKSSDIIEALLECWVSVYGSFQRSIHDNGGEFIGAAFKEFCDLFGIQDGTSGAHSPWSCGVVEIHHAITDRTYEALRRDFPHYRKEVLLQWAVMVKNSMPSATGWSPFQAVYGTNPQLPSLMTTNIAGMREEVTCEQLVQNMNALAKARVRFNQALCDTSLSRMLKAKVRRNQTVFKLDDKVYWRSPKSVENWRQGKVLAVDGKVLWIRDGTHIHRVSSDMTIKKGEEFDKNGKLVSDELKQDRANNNKERNVTAPRPWKYSVDEEEEYRRSVSLGAPADEPLLPVPDEPEDPPQGPSGTAPATDSQQSTIDDSQEDSPGAPSGHNYANGEGLQRPAGPHAQVNTQPASAASNSIMSEEQTSDEPPPPENLQTFLFDNYGDPNRRHGVEDGLSGSTPVDENLAQPDRDAEAVMVRAEMADQRREHYTRRAARLASTGASPTGGATKKTRQRRGSSTSAKKFPNSTLPKLNVNKGDIIIHEGVRCKVTERMKKAGGMFNYYNLQPQDGSAPYRADLERSEYQTLVVNDNHHQVLITTVNAREEVHMAIIPYNQHGSADCVEAKKEEIEKIVEKFNAVEVVDDVGQFRISCRFVLWYKKHSDGTIQTRARLVARGYEEKDDIPSDSPTLDQINLKLIMLIAQAKNMRLVTADVKSAFLQGLPLTEREVVVKPPKEAGLPKNKLWKLRVSLYGLDDASLRFHWKVKQVFKKLGMKQSKYDPALFYDRDGQGQLNGIIGTHVDDFLMAGAENWIDKMVEKIKVHFLLGKVEKKDFLYCGYRIKQEAGRITMDQREYAAEVPQLVIAPSRKKEKDMPVTDAERKQIRAAAGKMGWLARATRPDLIRAQVEASARVTRAVVSDLKDVQKALAKIQNVDSIAIVPKLPADPDNWVVHLATDASWQALLDGGSTAGRVIFISGAKASFPIFWSTNRIRKVCQSAQTAEIMALNTGMSEADYVREMINEITGKYIPVVAFIDNANAYKSIISNTAAQDKGVRLQVAVARQALQQGELEAVRLVEGAKQLADGLTKATADCTDLLRVVQTGVNVEALMMN